MSSIMWNRAALFICAAAVLGTGAAQAVTVIDFRGDGGLDTDGESSYSFGPVDGITVKATATSRDDTNDPQQTAWIGQYSAGLGVTNLAGDGSDQVDGSGWTDTIWLEFNKEVTITHILFSYVEDDGDDVWLLDADGNEIGDYDLTQQSNNSPYYSWLNLSGEGVTGDTFGFNAPFRSDSWMLAEIKVEPHVIVPTPTAALAGSILLGGLALRRRRRRA